MKTDTAHNYATHSELSAATIHSERQEKLSSETIFDDFWKNIPAGNLHIFRKIMQITLTTKKIKLNVVLNAQGRFLFPSPLCQSPVFEYFYSLCKSKIAARYTHFQDQTIF